MRYLFSAFQKVLETYIRTQKSCGRILMFHQVNNSKDYWHDTNVSITLDSFEQLIVKLIDNGTIFKSIGEIHNQCDENICYLTFDDGYSDVFENAYPLLKELKIPFTVFLTTNFIGRRDYLNDEMIKNLLLDPLCTFGSHSVSHIKLRFVNNLDSFKEVMDSKLILEKYLRKEIEYFAFPYGSIYACSQKDIRNVEKAGYHLAFSTINGNLYKTVISNKYFIPRINVNEGNYLNLW